MRRYVAFVRVSGKNQEDNTSLVNQRQRIGAWANFQEDVEIVHWIEAVESATCFTEDRKLFQEALNLVREYDGLIVYDLDRFFRNTEEGLRIARTEFLASGKTLISLNQNVDIGADDGWFTFIIFMATAELEARKLKRRATQGKAQKKRQDGYIGGRPPYGWLNRDGGLVMCPFQQEVRRYILMWHEHGMTAGSIARRLNLMVVPTQSGKAKWKRTTVFNILNRQSYLAEWYERNEQRKQIAS